MQGASASTSTRAAPLSNNCRAHSPAVAPVVMTSSTSMMRPLSGLPTRLPPSPWSLASLRLKHQGTSTSCCSTSCTAVAEAMGIPL
mgnify:CR=1 FL=1